MIQLPARTLPLVLEKGSLDFLHRLTVVLFEVIRVCSCNACASKVRGGFLIVPIGRGFYHLHFGAEEPFDAPAFVQFDLQSLQDSFLLTL